MNTFRKIIFQILNSIGRQGTGRFHTVVRTEMLFASIFTGKRRLKKNLSKCCVISRWKLGKKRCLISFCQIDDQRAAYQRATSTRSEGGGAVASGFLPTCDLYEVGGRRPIVGSLPMCDLSEVFFYPLFALNIYHGRLSA
jgi:hypothetical protein